MKKKESDIREKVESGQQSLSTKRVKFAFSEIEGDLYKRFVDGISGQACISAAVLMEKAHQPAEQNGMAKSEYMKIDINWINRFKKRRGIFQIRLHGEGASANEAQAENWKSNVLTLIQRQFKPEDIYNLDETTVLENVATQL